MARFPKPYIQDIPEAGKTPGIIMVPLNYMDLGARKSGMPARASDGPGSIEHVSKDAVK